MKHKYCNKSDIWKVKAKVTDSSTWKNILATRQAANDLIFWDIGKWDIDFWRDHWLGDMAFIDLDTHINSFPTMAAFWQGDNWDIPKL